MKIIEATQSVKRILGNSQDDMIKALQHIMSIPYGQPYYSPEKANEVLVKCVKHGHLSVLEHFNITVLCLTNIGTDKDFTRHRHCAFTIESTSYSDAATEDDEYCVITTKPLEPNERSLLEYNFKVYNEKCAKYGKKVGRDFLPQCTAAWMAMTTNIREWRHIISIRGAPEANPLAADLRDKIWMCLNRWYPLFFPFADEASPLAIIKYNHSTLKAELSTPMEAAPLPSQPQRHSAEEFLPGEEEPDW